jgi:hypothetical protein
MMSQTRNDITNQLGVPSCHRRFKHTLVLSATVQMLKDLSFLRLNNRPFGSVKDQKRHGQSVQLLRFHTSGKLTHKSYN